MIRTAPKDWSHVERHHGGVNPSQGSSQDASHDDVTDDVIYRRAGNAKAGVRAAPQLQPGAIVPVRMNSSSRAFYNPRESLSLSLSVVTKSENFELEYLRGAV